MEDLPAELKRMIEDFAAPLRAYATATVCGKDVLSVSEVFCNLEHARNAGRGKKRCRILFLEEGVPISLAPEAVGGGGRGGSNLYAGETVYIDETEPYVLGRGGVRKLAGELGKASQRHRATHLRCQKLWKIRWHPTGSFPLPLEFKVH